METLTDPAPAADRIAPSLAVRILDAGEFDAVRAAVKAWIDSHGIAQLAGLDAAMTLTRATLIPVAKVQLRTRYETRSVTSKTETYQSGAHYERRTFKESDFPVWGYLLGEGAACLRAGELPQSVTQKVPFSDAITDCAACRGVGSNRCGGCGGQGHCLCRSCGGGLEIKCASCSGVGEKKCWTCNGHGEKKCYACNSGTRPDGSRCTTCHGRGFTRCNECSDGFKTCGTCARRGIVRCPSCDSAGRATCGGCSGAGKVGCAPCKGSGKFVATLYITASQSEKVADAWALPARYDELVPADVAAWIERDVGTTAARELSAQRFDAAPCEPADSPLADAAERLIRESKRNVRNQSAADRLDLSHITLVNRVVQHWYAEHHLPLVKVDYRYDGKDYALWTVAPGVTVAGHEHGYARQGASVFASEGPVIAYLERACDEAAAASKSGKLALAGRLADGLLKAVPGFRKAAALKAANLRAHNYFASLGSLLAAAGASTFYMARIQLNAPAPLSDGAIAAVVIGVLAVAAPFALARIVYQTRMVAVVAHCALVSAIFLPVVAMLKPAPAGAALGVSAPKAVASIASPAPKPDRRTHREAAGFDCGQASSVVEKMICADQRLSSLDGTLARSYKTALAHAGDPQTLRGAQRTWLSRVRNRCRDPECLAQAYELQLAKLGRQAQ